MPDEKILLKDLLFNEETVLKFVTCINNVYRIETDKFVKEALVAFPNLELKERMSKLREMIESYVSEDYKTTLGILSDSLKGLEEGDESFVFGAYQDYIMINGCTDEYVDISLYYMGEFTKYFSAEFAIRCFINRYPDKTFEVLKKWSVSDNVQQRRLVSEGIRPKLPWAIAIDFDYKKASTLLDNLYFDTERFVTRSVANHLNDISKFDPDFVVETLSKWKDENKQDLAEMKYILNHSLRTSIKKSHVKSLNLLGYKADADIEVCNFTVSSKNISVGDTLEFAFDINALEDTSLMIDYNINYPMAKGKRSNKVFKIKKITLKKDDVVTIVKKHPFKIMTTKKLYTGNYKLNLQINGCSYENEDFHMEV